jgi:hypothetical protein
MEDGHHPQCREHDGLPRRVAALGAGEKERSGGPLLLRHGVRRRRGVRDRGSGKSQRA